MTRVLITGGSGFLGRGILRLSENLGWDCTVFSRDEYKQDLAKRTYKAKWVLGDVCDYDRLVSVFRGHDLVIHTAAIKFIPEAEHNVLETIKVNVEGSLNVFRACEAAGVKQCVAISTDKACAPVNVYGMTKSLVERMVGEFTRRGLCEFYACRYGNVIGSTGSVIPLFERQLASNGRITITDPDMTRYWISVNQAVDLIANTLKWCHSGSVLIPEPAAMKLLDLAVLVTGFEQGRAYDRASSPIKITGPRPGEKRHEQLMHQQESVRARNIGGHYELYDALHEPVGEPFILTSNTPRVWCSNEFMLNAIEDAKSV